MKNALPNQPQRPEHISAYAERTLQSLAAAGLGDRIALGGALGLLHYLDYRDTHDVDAWWNPATTSAERLAVIETIETALRPYGVLKRRAWGDVVSIELALAGKTVFSFQIAQRSAQLQPTISVQWTDVQLDSFADLLASKMVALVERGAPRDFRDIYTICQAALATPTQCWQLWQQRQQAAGNPVDIQQAFIAIASHLERIEQHRPLGQIAEPAARIQANETRRWFRIKFLVKLSSE
jgi:Nucleotidyl transferase AbiEii toxin, Type IV TA system